MATQIQRVDRRKKIANAFQAKETIALQTEKRILLDRNRLKFFLKSRTEWRRWPINYLLTIPHSTQGRGCQKQFLGNSLSTKAAPSHTI